MKTARPHPLRIPAAIAVATLIGLVVGLLGDGGHDVIAWIGLSIPLVPVGWALLQRTRS